MEEDCEKMTDEKGVPVITDEWGRGTNCSKCGKICYLILFGNKHAGDAWSTSTLAQFDHSNCDEALVVTGKQQELINFWNKKEELDVIDLKMTAEDKFEESVAL